MSTVRIYNKDNRISTGKPWKNVFLQVYPTVIEFESETAWRNAWSKCFGVNIVFKVEENRANKKPAPTKSDIPPSRNWNREPLGYSSPFIAPAGTYYIGNLSDVLYKHIYDDVFGKNGYDTGVYKKNNSFFMVHETSFGNGHKYCVDSGIIGICTIDLIDHSKYFISGEGGKIVTFDSPVHVKMCEGHISFTSDTCYKTFQL